MSSRVTQNKELILAPSGWTYFWRFVLWDYETGGMWFIFDDDTQLTSITGPLAGNRLASYPHEKTTWADWKAKHPDAKFMKQPE